MPPVGSQWPPVVPMLRTATNMRGPGVLPRAMALRSPTSMKNAAAHIANGGESCHQRDLRVHRGIQGLFRNRLAETLDEVLRRVVRALHAEVGVGVDKAGHKGGVPQVDDLGAGRQLGGRNCLDLLPRNHHDPGRRQRIGVAVEQAGGFEDDGAGGPGAA